MKLNYTNNFQMDGNAYEQPTSAPNLPGKYYVEVDASTPPEDEGWYHCIYGADCHKFLWFDKEAKIFMHDKKYDELLVKSWLKPYTPPVATFDKPFTFIEGRKSFQGDPFIYYNKNGGMCGVELKLIDGLWSFEGPFTCYPVQEWLNAPDFEGIKFDEQAAESMALSTPAPIREGVDAEGLLNEILQEDANKGLLQDTVITRKHNGLEYDMVRKDLAVIAMKEFASRFTAPTGAGSVNTLLAEVLYKYIKYIRDVDGTDYILVHDERYASDVKFTDEEWQLLTDVAKK